MEVSDDFWEDTAQKQFSIILETLKVNKHLGKDLAGAEPSVHRKCNKKIIVINFWKIKWVIPEKESYFYYQTLPHICRVKKATDTRHRTTRILLKAILSRQYHYLESCRRNRERELQ